MVNETEKAIKGSAEPYVSLAFGFHSSKEPGKGNCLQDLMIIYSRLSLSRLRLSRTTAYLEKKIGSLF